MANGFQNNLITNNNETVLNLENTATFLGISTATVRNWVKCGHLQTLDNNTKYFFNFNEVENVKSKISNGDLEKLNKRANKAKAGRTFIPEEYLIDRSGLNDLNSIVDFIKCNNMDLFSAILLVSLNLLKKEQMLSGVNIEDIIQGKDLSFSNKQICEEIKSWLSETKKENIHSDHSFLLDCSIPKQRDVLGFIYQSLLLEGEKSQNGSYYTPSIIVDEIVKEYVKKDSKILDPCCGTGQFLLAFADTVENPSNIYGVDIDEIAVRIARLNILIKYKNKNFAPNIACKNTLLDIGNYDLFSLKENDENIRDFDVVATNPPWGVHFSTETTENFKKIYPGISSLESFSYFLKKSIDLLKDGGIISYILPEAILNVKTHRDIRGIILNETHIKKIIYLNRVFKNVFTPVIRLDLEKNQKENGKIEICKENGSYFIEQARWKNNQDFIFDIHASEFDAEIIQKIYDTSHTTLEGKADWALGIVTGNNAKYIADEQKEEFEEVYKGKDVEKFVLKNPSSYIRFTPEKFQQVAPEQKYRTKEKLIYRFISKNLVFAYDDKQRLTLNSANIVIPLLVNYPIKVILALFNSTPYQFIYQKKFASIKILRGHIEQLPLPLWSDEMFNKIITMVERILMNDNCFELLDDFIMRALLLNDDEINYLKDTIKD